MKTEKWKTVKPALHFKVAKLVFTVTTDLNHDQRMARICDVLRQNGFAVTLVGRKFSDSKPLQNQGYTTVRLPVYFSKGKLAYLEYNLRLFFYLLFKSCDVICSCDLDTVMPGLLVSILRRKKLVMDAHEYFPETSGLYNRGFEKKIWQWVERVSIPRIQKGYTVSHGIADIFHQKYGVKYDVIRNVPNYSEEKSLKKPGNYILYQGVLNKGRGLEELLEAMADLDLDLKIAGNGPLFELIQHKIKQKGLEGRVELLGWVAPQQLRALTKGAFLGVNLLKGDGLSYYLSLANKFFDYFHAGVPQICMNYPEYIRINEEFEVALLINDLSKDVLVNAVNSLKNNPEYYKKLENNCEQAAVKINWQRESEKLIQFYKVL